MVRSVTRALAALLGLVTALPVAAAPRLVVVAVGTSEVPRDEVQALQALLDGRARKDGRFQVLSAPALCREDDAAQREVKAAEADRVLGEARDAFDNLKLKPALDLAQKAARLREESDLSAGVGGLLEAMALKVLVLAAKGDRAEAGNEAQRVLVLQPDYAWDRGRLNPQAQALIEPRRAKVRAAPPATLEVETQPPGAQVFVDGVARGRAPLKLPGLRPGSHVVSAVAVGYELEQQLAFAGAGKPVVLTLRQSERGRALLPLLAELQGAGGAGAAGRLAVWAQADEAVVARLEPRGAGRALRLTRANALGDEVASAAGEGAAADLLPQLLEQVLSKAPQAPQPPPPDKVVGRATVELPAAPDVLASRRRWGFVALGVGAACGVGGVVLGAVAKGEAGAANALPQTDQAGYAQRAGTARALAGVADGLFVAALAGAGLGLGLVLANLDPSPPSEEEALLTPVLFPGGGGVALSGRLP